MPSSYYFNTHFAVQKSSVLVMRSLRITYPYFTAFNDDLPGHNKMMNIHITLTSCFEANWKNYQAVIQMGIERCHGSTPLTTKLQ